MEMAKKRQYLFYTTEGFTQAPDGVEIDNCQILAFIDAEEERQAWQKFKVENAWMEGRGFSLQGEVCRELLVSEGNRNKDSGMPRFLIRPASFTDLPQIMEIYAAARDFMRRSGNPGQWIDGYPQETVVRRDLENGDLFVGEWLPDSGDVECRGRSALLPCGGTLDVPAVPEKASSVGESQSSEDRPASRTGTIAGTLGSCRRPPLCGVFCHKSGPDSTYARIEEGAWPDNRPYYVLHRIASAPGIHGFASACIDWCLQRFPVLRVDTHADNRPMLHLMEKKGFARCGIIYVENGTPRTAFQKTVDK